MMADALSKHKLMFLFIVLFLILPQAATDIYLPSVHAISIYFAVHHNAVQLTISLYMLGLAVSQLVYGPLSDGIGRKTPLIIGLVISFVGCLLCLCAWRIEVLMLGRFIQGMGAGACSCLFRVILNDVFQGNAMVKASSYIIMIFTITLPIMPVVGGYLQHHFFWQANFIVLGGIYSFSVMYGDFFPSRNK